MKQRPKLKTMIWGLDGATFDLIMPFVNEGRLPTFARLLENGAWGDLRSTIPPITAAAWTSFMTGENPGKHGVINFVKATTGMASGKANQEIITTENFAGRTFFDVMSNKGMKLGVITVPVTYPPWDINGMMISGYPSPDNDKIYSISKDISLNIEEPLNFSAEYYRISSEEQILEDCLYRDKLRSGLMFDLLDQNEFDCFVLVMGGTDRSQHDYWKYHDPEYPGVSQKQREKFRDAIFRNYKLADTELATFLDRYGKETNLFIISDHGAGRHPFSFFNVNLWLKKKGFLRLKQSKALPREMLRKIYYGLQEFLIPKHNKSSHFVPKVKATSPMIGGGVGKVFDWENTMAFHYSMAYPAGGIMINLKGRQPNGKVILGREYETLVNKIVGELSQCRDNKTDKKIMEQVFRREEIYEGPYVDAFPDIVYVLNPSYESGKEIFGSLISPVPKLRLSKKSGLHLMNGIFIAHGPQIMPGHISGANIVDVAPTVLYSAGLGIPEDMDGKVLKAAFDKELLLRRPVEYSAWKGKKSIKKAAALDGKEQEQMEEKLRSLGYL